MTEPDVSKAHIDQTIESYAERCRTRIPQFVRVCRGVVCLVSSGFLLVDRSATFLKGESDAVKFEVAEGPKGPNATKVSKA